MLILDTDFLSLLTSFIASKIMRICQVLSNRIFFGLYTICFYMSHLFPVAILGSLWVVCRLNNCLDNFTLDFIFLKTKTSFVLNKFCRLISYFPNLTDSVLYFISTNVYYFGGRFVSINCYILHTVILTFKKGYVWSQNDRWFSEQVVLATL